jgi:hypothetical protein
LQLVLESGDHSLRCRNALRSFDLQPREIAGQLGTRLGCALHAITSRSRSADTTSPNRGARRSDRWEFRQFATGWFRRHCRWSWNPFLNTNMQSTATAFAPERPADTGPRHEPSSDTLDGAKLPNSRAAGPGGAGGLAPADQGAGSKGGAKAA